MKRQRFDVPDAELAVLKVLWDQGATTIRQITDVLYPGNDFTHYATVQKLLERLRDRKLVTRRRKGRVNEYEARIVREELIRHRLSDTADKLCEGSMTPLLMQLVHGKGLSREEIHDLRQLIDQLDDEGDTT